MTGSTQPWTRPATDPQPIEGERDAVERMYDVVSVDDPSGTLVNGRDYTCTGDHTCTGMVEDTDVDDQSATGLTPVTRLRP